MLCKEASTLNYTTYGRDDFYRNFFQVNLAIFLLRALVLTVSAHSLLSGLISLDRTGPLARLSVHIHLQRVSGASSSPLHTTIEKNKSLSLQEHPTRRFFAWRPHSNSPLQIPATTNPTTATSEGTKVEEDTVDPLDVSSVLVATLDNVAKECLAHTTLPT